MTEGNPHPHGPDRNYITARVPCPKCGVAAGSPCQYSGKGAIKAMRIGRNHHDRMQAAQKKWNDETPQDMQVIE